MALEFGELSCMPVMADRVLVIVSPDVGRAQMPSVPGWVGRQSPHAGDVANGPLFRPGLFRADTGISYPLTYGVRH
jgi:hypothetical protein